ncbi:Uncharacterised protein [Bordetella trematum]|nr:Uncharacterised protein [Bordetella trematum]
MAIAADVFGKGSDCSRSAEFVDRQMGQQGLDQVFVLADERTFHAALRRVAEGVGPGAAYALAARQPAQCAQGARAEGHFARHAAVRVLAGQQRRRHVKAQGEVAFELFGQLRGEAAVGVEARDFVLVLVGHQLVEAARHGQRKPGRGCAELALACRDPFDQAAVAHRVGGVLVGGEVLDTLFEQRLQAFGPVQRDHLGGRLEREVERLRFMRSQAACVKGAAVGRHGHAIEFDGAHEGGQRQGHVAALPGIAQQENIRQDAVAEQPEGRAMCVQGRGPGCAGGVADLLQQRFATHGHIGLPREVGHRRHIGVGQHPRMAMAQRAQGVRRDRRDRVAQYGGVRLLPVQAGRARGCAGGRQADVADHRAAFLGQAGDVQHAGRQPLQMGRHRNQCADGDDAGAAHACDQQAVGRVQRLEGRFGQQIQARLPVVAGVAALFARAPALDRHEAGAEAFGAGVILVAAGLVNRALAAIGRLQRHDGQAVRLLAAVAAALAHGAVDEQPAGRIGEGFFLAAAALLGGAGLVVDQDGHARRGAQLALQGVELATVMHLDAGAEIDAGIFFRFVGGDHDARHVLAAQLLADLGHRDGAVHRLAAGHGHGIVEQDFVGDVGARGHCLADGQVAGVVVSALAHVLKDMRGLDIGRQPDPVHALAAHLGQACGVALHPGCHIVAAHPGARLAAFGHPGRGVVRTA